MLQIAERLATGRLWATWLTWWLGDAVSALTVAPLLIVWATRRPPFEAVRARRAAGDAVRAVAVSDACSGARGCQWGNRLPMGTGDSAAALGGVPFYQHGRSRVAIICACARVGHARDTRARSPPRRRNRRLLLLQAFAARWRSRG
jgi:hypothetical protein